MKKKIFFFCTFIAVISAGISASAPVLAEEPLEDEYADYRIWNIKDGFVPPEDETIQYLWDNVVEENSLWKTFQKKRSVYALDKNDPSIGIANEIDEIPCGQHHRFTLVVFSGKKQEVVWHSSRPDIARIDANTGEMTATGEGSVRVWVTDASGRVKATTSFEVTPEMTQEENDALYWDKNNRFMREGTVYWSVWGAEGKLILPENATAIVSAFQSHEKVPVQVRVPASVRAVAYDASMEDQWGLFCGEKVTVSVDGNNRNYYSLFGILFSYAFEHPVKPELAYYEVDFLYPADCKYRALLVYPPDRKNEVYYVPDGVERIAGRAFEGAKYLRKVVISDTVKIIGPDAFLDCDSLEEIVIPESVVEFEDNGYVDAIDAEMELVEMGLKAKITIITPKGSAAEAYAIEHGIAYRNE